MKLSSQPFAAVIFDMDGVLIDSEPLWKIAMYEVFEPLGGRLEKTDFQQTVGLRIDQVVHHWNLIHNWKLTDEKRIVQAIMARMIALIRENPFALEGVYEILQYLNKQKILVGLATSSPVVLLEAVLDALQLRPYFQTLHSAEHLTYGKPHPEVYLQAAKTLQLRPSECLVVEDSLNGVISGKSAGMTVVCIPEKTHQSNPKLILADYHYTSLAEFLEILRTENSIESIG